MEQVCLSECLSHPAALPVLAEHVSRLSEDQWGEGGAGRLPTLRGAHPRVLQCPRGQLGEDSADRGPSPASPVPWPRSDPGGEWSERAAWGAGWLRSGYVGPEVSGEPRMVMTSRGSRGREDRGAGSWSAREEDGGLPRLRRKLRARGFALQVWGLQASEPGCRRGNASRGQAQWPVALRPAPAPGCPFGCRASGGGGLQGAAAAQADALDGRGAHGGAAAPQGVHPRPAQASAPSATAGPSAAAFVWEKEQGRPSCSSLTPGCESTSPARVPPQECSRWPGQEPTCASPPGEGQGGLGLPPRPVTWDPAKGSWPCRLLPQGVRDLARERAEPGPRPLLGALALHPCGLALSPGAPILRT